MYSGYSRTNIFNNEVNLLQTIKESCSGIDATNDRVQDLCIIVELLINKLDAIVDGNRLNSGT